MKIRETTIKDTATGELFIKKREPVEYYNEDGYLLFIKKNYSRVFSDIRLPECFCDSDLGKIYRLQAYIDQKTNMLMKRTNKGKRVMSASDIIAVTGLADRAGRMFLKKLIDNEVIGLSKWKCGEKNPVEERYYFNPIYFHNQKRLSVELYTTFKTQIDPFLATWVKNNFRDDMPIEEVSE